MCDVTAYAGKRAARRAAVLTKYSRGEPMREYHCPACGMWHLSTNLDTAPTPRQRTGKTRPVRVRTLDELERVAAQMRGGQ